LATAMIPKGGTNELSEREVLLVPSSLVRSCVVVGGVVSRRLTSHFMRESLLCSCLLPGLQPAGGVSMPISEKLWFPK